MKTIIMVMMMARFVVVDDGNSSSLTDGLGDEARERAREAPHEEGEGRDERLPIKKMMIQACVVGQVMSACPSRK